MYCQRPELETMEAIPLDACASIVKFGVAIPSGSVTVNVPEIEASSWPEPLISPEKILGSSTAVKNAYVTSTKYSH